MVILDVINKYREYSNLTYRRSTHTNTMRGYESIVKQFCVYMRNIHIEKVTDEDVARYFNLQADVGYTMNTLVPKSIAVRNLFKYAFKLGLKVINYELIPVIRKQFRMPRVVEDIEIEEILKKTPIKSKSIMQIRNRAILNFLRSTGCRNTELCFIDLPNLLKHFDDRRVVIATAKAYRGLRPIRELFWDEDTHEDLKRWIDARASLCNKIKFKDPDALFVALTNAQQGMRLTTTAICIILRRMSERAMIDTANPHSFRHHRGHELSSSGANNSIISGILGHSSLGSSFIYTQMNSKEMKVAANKYRK